MTSLTTLRAIEPEDLDLSFLHLKCWGLPPALVFKKSQPL